MKTQTNNDLPLPTIREILTKIWKGLRKHLGTIIAIILWLLLPVVIVGGFMFCYWITTLVGDFIL